MSSSHLANSFKISSPHTFKEAKAWLRLDYAPCDWFKGVSVVLCRLLTTINMAITVIIVARTTNMRPIIVILIPKGVIEALSS
jgi:hypothetical protein